MSLFNRVVKDIKKSREYRLSGNLNCIPWGFPRFEMDHPGLEQRKFYIVTANSKVGKTQITDYMFMYHPFEFLLNNPNMDINLKIFYFSLEMSKEEKMNQAIARRLFLRSKGELVVDPKNLQSKYRQYILDKDVLDMIEKEEEYFKKFEDCVTFIDNIRNPFGIYKFMRDYANQNGVQHKKKIPFENKKNGETIIKEVDDFYEPHDPNQYTIVIVDHARLLLPERGGTLHKAIGDLTSNYFLIMRDKWNFSPVLIQQQAAAQESIENAKFGRLHPTLDGLGVNKETQQDANTIFGLFSPFRHKLKDYEGYKVLKYGDHLRFLEILGGRDGGAGTIVPLIFHGGVNYFREAASLKDESKVLEDHKLCKYFQSYKLNNTDICKVEENSYS